MDSFIESRGLDEAELPPVTPRFQAFALDSSELLCAAVGIHPAAAEGAIGVGADGLVPWKHRSSAVPHGVEEVFIHVLPAEGPSISVHDELQRLLAESSHVVRDQYVFNMILNADKCPVWSEGPAEDMRFIPADSRTWFKCDVAVTAFVVKERAGHVLTRPVENGEGGLSTVRRGAAEDDVSQRSLEATAGARRGNGVNLQRTDCGVVAAVEVHVADFEDITGEALPVRQLHSGTIRGDPVLEQPCRLVVVTRWYEWYLPVVDDSNVLIRRGVEVV